MARKKQKAQGSELVGRAVTQPAREFGKTWAFEEYGDGWETALVTGEVARVGGAGTTARKPVLVIWCNGDEECMTQQQCEEILSPTDGPATGMCLAVASQFSLQTFGSRLSDRSRGHRLGGRC